MDDVKKFSRSLLCISGCLLALSGCDRDTTGSTTTASPTSPAPTTAPADRGIHVNPALAHELTKRVPELLIVGADNRCLYYSTGYSEGYFNEALQQVFNPSTPSLQAADITQAMRDDYTRQNAEAVAQLKATLAASPTLDDALREQSLNRVLDSAILSQANGETSGAPTCNEHLDEHLSWLLDTTGQPLTREQATQSGAITIIQYRKDDCAECDAQHRELIDYVQKAGINAKITRASR